MSIKNIAGQTKIPPVYSRDIFAFSMAQLQNDVLHLERMYDVRWTWYRSTWILGTLNYYVIVLPRLGNVAIYPTIRNSAMQTPGTSFLARFKFIILQITSPTLPQDTNHSFHPRCFPTTRGMGAKFHQRRKRQTRGRREPSDWRHQRLP